MAKNKENSEMSYYITITKRKKKIKLFDYIFYKKKGWGGVINMFHVSTVVSNTGNKLLYVYILRIVF